MISPDFYQPLYLIVVLLITVVLFFGLYAKGNQYSVLREKRSSVWMFFLCVLLIIFIATRPRHAVFGDSSTYEDAYNNITPSLPFVDNKGDVLFDLLMYWAKPIMSWQGFAFLIAVVYVIGQWIASRRLSPNSTDVMMLFCISAFSFWGYAVNGLRNGMACAILLVALTFLVQKKPKVLLFLLVAFIAVGCHKSVYLPSVCALLAYYYRNPKVVFYFWFLSIPLSLVAGSTVEGFLTNLDVDDRMGQYLSDESKNEYAYLFSRTGFRWDFLLYSFMPILLGWYVIFKRKILDWKYILLLSTYIYSNSFWIMVIRSSNSNRFAYLSWFLYPIVLSYPLLRIPVFKSKHTQKTALILIAHTLFTVFMCI